MRIAPATTGAHFCYIRDVASGEFWSAAYQPTLKRATEVMRRFSRRPGPNSAAATATSIRTPKSPSRPKTTSKSAGSRSPTASSQHETIEVDQLRGSRSGARRRPTRCIRRSAICSFRPRSSRTRQAILCTRRPRSIDEQMPWMFHLMAVHGPRPARRFLRNRPHAIPRSRRHRCRSRRR